MKNFNNSELDPSCTTTSWSSIPTVLYRPQSSTTHKQDSLGSEESVTRGSKTSWARVAQGMKYKLCRYKLCMSVEDNVGSGQGDEAKPRHLLNMYCKVPRAIVVLRGKSALPSVFRLRLGSSSQQRDRLCCSRVENSCPVSLRSNTPPCKQMRIHQSLRFSEKKQGDGSKFPRSCSAILVIPRSTAMKNNHHTSTRGDDRERHT